MPRQQLKQAARIVVKVGTSTLTSSDGRVDHINLNRLAEEIAKLHQEERNIILVSSGAIAMGAERLDQVGKLRTIPQKQAAAAVGQSLLMKEYEAAFSKHGIAVGQVLLTRDIMESKVRHANARATLDTLLELKAIPIINENDTVAVEEIKVGDNDNLAVMVGQLAEAKLVILLTDTEGFYLDPKGSEPPLSVIKEITTEIRKAARQTENHSATGGMITKLQAAEASVAAGIPLVIASGRQAGVLKSIVDGQHIGTLFTHKELNKG